MDPIAARVDQPEGRPIPGAGWTSVGIGHVTKRARTIMLLGRTDVTPMRAGEARRRPTPHPLRTTHYALRTTREHQRT
jgi:hypothetical protein